MSLYMVAGNLKKYLLSLCVFKYYSKFLWVNALKILAFENFYFMWMAKADY